MGLGLARSLHQVVALAAVVGEHLGRRVQHEGAESAVENDRVGIGDQLADTG